MQYYSTRSSTGYVSAAEAILKGLAPDGGLFVPVDKAAPFNIDDLKEKSYRELALTLFKPFLSGYTAEEVEDYINGAYSNDNFDHRAITPLRQLSSDISVLELYHGPTYAFKDIALQVLPYLLTGAIRNTGEKSEVVILTATSGDTGKSALEGFSDVEKTRIIVYYPEKGISAIQERQMTTQEGSNVAVAAVKGNFDSAQSGVKAIFSSPVLGKTLEKAGFRLSSANSINWGRLLPQVVYYFSAYLELLRLGRIRQGEKVNYVVPTGNFGNILAGYYAKELGLPVKRLICAANSNNVLTDFIRTGVYDSRRELCQTISPSMDILVSSNLERLLFELTGHDSEKIEDWMTRLKTSGFYRVDPDTLTILQKHFWSGFADDQKTIRAIKSVYQDYSYLIDTHTAVGKDVLEQYRSDTGDFAPAVLLATASPFKFSGSVVEALFGQGEYSGRSEFELLSILAEKTGCPVPANLVGLEDKNILHGRVIDPDKMESHLLSALGLTG